MGFLALTFARSTWAKLCQVLYGNNNLFISREIGKLCQVKYGNNVFVSREIDNFFQV